MLQILTNYYVVAEVGEQHIQLVVSGESELKTFLDILIFNGVANIQVGKQPKGTFPFFGPYHT